jgi:hypothetical protein
MDADDFTAALTLAGTDHRYDGEFFEGAIQGRGVFQQQNGRRYEGQVKLIVFIRFYCVGIEDSNCWYSDNVSLFPTSAMGKAR